MKASLQPILEGLGRRLQRTVALQAAQGRLVAQWSRPGTEIDIAYAEMVVLRRWPPSVERWIRGHQSDASGSLTVPPNAQLGLPALTGWRIDCNGQMVGTLWLLEGDGPLSKSEQAVVTSTTLVLGELLFSQRALQPGELAEGPALLEGLLTEGAETKLQADRLVRGGTLVDTGRYVALVAAVRRGGPHALTVAEQTALRLAQNEVGRYLPMRHAISVMRREHLVLLIAASPRVQLDAVSLAVRLVQATNAKLTIGEATAVVGVGGEVAMLDEVPRSYRQGRLASRLAGTLPGLGPVADWGGLGVQRLLVQFPFDDLDRDIPAGIRRLMSDPDSSPLVETLDAYLRSAGDAQRTAMQLGLHKGTLYDRLHRIERITEMSFRKGDDRLAMHLGMRLLQLAAALE